jgi:hypothetical protein
MSCLFESGIYSTLLQILLDSLLWTAFSHLFQLKVISMATCLIWTWTKILQPKLNSILTHFYNVHMSFLPCGTKVEILLGLIVLTWVTWKWRGTHVLLGNRVEWDSQFCTKENHKSSSSCSDKSNINSHLNVYYVLFSYAIANILSASVFSPWNVAYLLLYFVNYASYAQCFLDTTAYLKV